MPTLWFILVAWMLATYVALDGFDLGAAVAGRFVARTPAERGAVLRSIGPVWDGNEVWLVAAGGTLYCVFPALYATSFSGFYLPLMMVLWLLIGRGVAIELRGHLASPVWVAFWDAVFFAASGLLCLFFGVALGNVVRGVPLGPDGQFFLPLWTDFRIGVPAGILDGYTLLVGVAALAALALHGTLWLALKLPGELEARARRLALPLWGAVVLLTAILTTVSFSVQNLLPRHLAERPWGYAFPLLAVAGLAGVALNLRRRAPLAAFLSSCAYLLGMLSAAAFGLYPYVLPALPDATAGLPATAAATSEHGLRVALAWWVPGMLLACGYSVYVYRSFAGKVVVEGDEIASEGAS
ncbi:MAG TPA: cytochrome d ubiquinol oxidase subunit II, partial [Thermoanaerobaculia bacterium]